MNINELLSKENLDHSKAIDELKSKRNTTNPETSTFKKELDPLKHDVYDTIKRPYCLSSPRIHVKMQPYRLFHQNMDTKHRPIKAKISHFSI